MKTKKSRIATITLFLSFALLFGGILNASQCSAATITKTFSASTSSPFNYYFAGYNDKTVTASFTAKPNSPSYVVKATVRIYENNKYKNVFSETFNSSQPRTISFKLLKDQIHQLIIKPVGYSGTVSGSFTIKYN